MTSRDFDRIWRVLDGQVESGRMPGYVAAVSLGGEVSVRPEARAHAATRLAASTSARRTCGRAVSFR